MNVAQILNSIRLCTMRTHARTNSRTHLNVFVKKFQIVRLVSAYVWTSELVSLYNANT